MKKTWQQRFAEKFTVPDDWAETDACWEWQGAKVQDGYGQIQIDGKFYLAHRLMWKLYHGDFPPSGLCVLHRCDNRKCVNINHLFVGTRADNTRDMLQKGRHKTPVGEHQGRSKLSKQDVESVFLFNRAGWRQYEIADHLGVTDPVISRLLSGKAWAHLTGGSL